MRLLKPIMLDTAVRDMKSIQYSTPSGGKSEPSRIPMVRFAQCLEPVLLEFLDERGYDLRPGREACGVPTTVSVRTRSGRRAANARASVPPHLQPTT